MYQLHYRKITVCVCTCMSMILPHKLKYLNACLQVGELFGVKKDVCPCGDRCDLVGESVVLLEGTCH